MKHVSLVAIALLACASQGQAATVYDLSGDFSDAANPNGVWSFLYGGAPLAHQAPLANGNHLVPVLANGMWGAGADLNINTPEIMKVTGPGTAASETLEDFLTGDVILHSPNDGSAISIVWTAPGDGMIELSSAYWYAHSLVDRSTDINVQFNGGSALYSAAIDKTVLRSTALNYDLSALGVHGGDTLSFAFAKTSGQQFGSLDGVAIGISFTAAVAAVPEPASWALMIGGFALAGAALRRREPGRPRYA